ncbi:hypothetical protein [Jiangella asiatica]|uniref:GH141-like insertion domain-containing protein n=1 Tax=Jiangella asiatica TaxID=2530372 RepID=A0A4V2Z325_9ACTN|nr:hypothetical protein [Jiangella asiatica]TDE11138.1 hypothetical protein E1269_09695 [Jiangella asiatica]
MTTAGAAVVAGGGADPATAARGVGESEPVELYVTPNLVDGADCSGSLPCSLERAQQEQRRHTAADAGAGRDVIVYLHGGTYRIAEPLTFDARDSGTSEHSVVWRNYPGESPVLSGGTPITGWTPGPDGVWSADAGGLNFLQLYATGQRFTRARTPNLGSFVQGQPFTLEGTNTTQVRVPADTLADWDLQQLERAQVIVHFAWRQWRYRIESTSADDTGNRWVVARQPEGSTGATGGEIPVATTTTRRGSVSPVYFENAREFLDQAGEWYLDTTADTVYLKPPDGANPNTLGVVAPVTEQLLDIDGASHLQFYGLQFAHSTWLLPDQQGNLQRQGGFHLEHEPLGYADGFPVWYVNPGAVNVRNASHISFRRNAFRFLGANGIVFGPATHDDEIVGNMFTHVADTAVFIGSQHDPIAEPDQENRNETVSNNYFAHMGEDYATDSAVTATFPNGLTVSNNLIRDVKNIAINVGSVFNIGDDVLSLRNVQITGNRIDASCTISADCGAIHSKNNYYYDLSGPNPVPRSTIDGNYITNVNENPAQPGESRVRGIYADDHTSNLLVSNNEWHNVDEPIRLHTTGGLNNDLVDNGVGNQDVIRAAGLEPAYLDLPTLDPDTDSVGGTGGPGSVTVAEASTVAPVELRQLGDGMATVTVTNPGDRPLRDLGVEVVAYDQVNLTQVTGQLVEPAANRHRPLAAGETRTLRWRFDVPLGTTAGEYDLLARVSYTTLDRHWGEAAAIAATSVLPAVTLTAEPADVVIGAGGRADLSVRITSHVDTPLTVGLSGASEPDGVRLEPSSAEFPLPAGGSRAMTVGLVGERPGPAVVDIGLTARTADGVPADVAAVSVPVNVAYGSLAGAFDNVGITDDANPDAGSWGRNGRSYSAQALADAGIVPGGPVIVDEAVFTWPDVPPGVPDNVQANGQLIAMAGAGSRLAVLGTSDGREHEGTGTVHYSDGTSSSFDLRFQHWAYPDLEPDPVVVMPYINRAGVGREDRPVGLYAQSVPIDPAKEVTAVELPAISAPGSHGMHVFALALAP